MGALISLGSDLHLWDIKKDTPTVKFIVEVSLVLVDKEGLALYFTGEATKEQVTLSQAFGGTPSAVQISCTGALRATNLIVGTFPPEAAAFEWTCKDQNSTGTFRQPVTKSVYNYDLSNFAVADDFVLADAKDAKKGTQAKVWDPFQENGQGETVIVAR